ncbi:hypothetical protein Asi02nite_02130 [Asanoa siamensis]|uniref:Uncharacterized protein n=1 Tax=Asanoa siamensis TaxID=926357 RepID=A0ABQ4CHE2_9ACTN|nr:hypothetical protein Asi02nite_02130 [Asanoa siamensis]
MPDSHDIGKIIIDRRPYVVTTAAVGLVEKLGEALGTPSVEKHGVHRGHPPSLITTVMPGWKPIAGRIEFNGRKARIVTGRPPRVTVGTRRAAAGRGL